VRHQWSEVSPQLGSDLNGNWDGGAPEGVVCIGQGQGAWWVRQPTAGLRRGTCWRQSRAGPTLRTGRHRVWMPSEPKALG